MSTNARLEILFSGPRADLNRRAETTDTIIIGVAVVAGLYFPGREVLVPMSIAILLSFVLAPVTDVLSRTSRIGRIRFRTNRGGAGGSRS